jgi:hypothetical protein
VTASTGASRPTQAGALAGTVTVLTRPGAQVGLAARRGRHVVLIAVSGPRQGAVDLDAAGVGIGHLSPASATWHRAVLALPARTFTGTLTLRSTSTAPVGVDALPVLRG